MDMTDEEFEAMIAEEYAQRKALKEAEFKAQACGPLDESDPGIYSSIQAQTRREIAAEEKRSKELKAYYLTNPCEKCIKVCAQQGCPDGFNCHLITSFRDVDLILRGILERVTVLEIAHIERELCMSTNDLVFIKKEN